MNDHADNRTAKEARAVAMLLGEASEFEKAAIAEEMAADPALSHFAGEIASLDKLLGEALAPASSPDMATWRLSPARRVWLANQLGLPAQHPSTPKPPRQRAGLAPGQKPKPRRGWLAQPWVVPATASALFGLILVAALCSMMLFRAGVAESEFFGNIAEGIADPRPRTDGDQLMRFKSGNDSPGERSVGFALPSPLPSASPSASVAASAPLARDTFAEADESKNRVGGGGDLDLRRSQIPREADDHQRRDLEGFVQYGSQPFDGPGGAADPSPEEIIGRAAPAKNFAAAKAEPPSFGSARGSGRANESSLVTSGVAEEATVAQMERVGDTPLRSRLFQDANPKPDTLPPLTSAPPSVVLRERELLARAAEPSLKTEAPESEGKRAEYRAEASSLAKAKVAPRETPAPNTGALFEKRTAAERVSTFSLHVSDVSFRMAAEAILDRGQPPSPSDVRPEEFTAAFDYGDPAPAGSEPVALAQSQSAHPFIPESNLLRLSLRTAAAGRAGATPLNLTVLLDVSGSMERPDRAGATRAAIRSLAKKLSPKDRISLMTFDRDARLVADRVSGDQALGVLLAAQAAVGESGTNLESAIAAAAEVARARFDAGAMNRLLLITDGVANLGDIVPETLARPVAGLRASGIALDIVAAGARGVGDRVLEALARGGDGRYFLLEDGGADADAFAEKLAGAFRPAARNVKIQIRFNPDRVAAWSLLGFDRHRLREEDFRDDSVDAAELAAAEQGSAVYQLRFVERGRGEVGQVSVRFEETATGAMVERTWVIPWQPLAPAFDLATPAHQLAGLATLVGEKLRGSATGQLVRLEDLAPAAVKVRERFGEDEKVRRLLAMVERLRAMEGP